MKVILIPCSGQKLGGGTKDYRQPRLLEILGDSQFRRLLATREEMGRLRGLAPGPDLGASDNSGAVEFRPAFERYDGIMYRRAEFRRLFPNFAGRVLIISALYGLLDAEDHIRYYNLAMDDSLPSGESVWHWWKTRGLQLYVETALRNAGPIEVHDLLSGLYRKAIGQLTSSGRNWNRTYAYPGQGTGSLYRRGEDLMRLLSGRDC